MSEPLKTFAGPSPQAGRYEARTPDRKDLARLSAASPDNPFATAEYFDARRMAGWTCWVLGPGGSTAPSDVYREACGAFLARRGPFNKLEIPSLPPVDGTSLFWPYLQRFCAEQQVTKLELGSFASPEGVEIPAFGTMTRRDRCEYILDLRGDLYAQMTNRHRANVKRARAAGLTLVRTRSADALASHQELIGASLARRRGRGELVPEVDSPLDAEALLASGAGELFQAVHEGAVFSSAIVLTASLGAYGHSTGTSPEGMGLGASHFLMHELALQLAAQGFSTLNFGDAPEDSGLSRFKRDFGTRRRYLPSATTYVGARNRIRLYLALRDSRRRLREADRWLRNAVRGLSRDHKEQPR